MELIKQYEVYTIIDTYKDKEVSGNISIYDNYYVLDVNIADAHFLYCNTANEVLNMNTQESGLTVEDVMEYMNTLRRYVSDTYFNKDVIAENNK